MKKAKRKEKEVVNWMTKIEKELDNKIKRLEVGIRKAKVIPKNEE